MVKASHLHNLTLSKNIIVLVKIQPGTAYFQSLQYLKILHFINHFTMVHLPSRTMLQTTFHISPLQTISEWFPESCKNGLNKSLMCI